MGVSKVDYGDRTLIDLTQDTVTADKLMQGYTAHGANGEQIVGTATGGSGDMLQADYDSDSAVKNSGGISNYVEENAVYQYPSNISSGSVLDALSLLYQNCPYSHGIAMALLENSVTGRPVGNGWGILILYNIDGTTSCHVRYQDTWSSKTVDGLFNYNGSNSTVTWNAYLQDVISNPNLIDNPWFTVNQRRRNSLPSVSYAYWMDRWKTEDLTYSDIHCGLDSYGLKIPSYSGGGQTLIEQYIGPEKINKFNRRYTLSIMYSDGSIESETRIIPTPTSTSSAVISFESPKGISLELLNIGSTGNYRVRIVIESEIPSEIIIRAVKLELGDVSTLAQDVMPDYATELLKCQLSTIDSQDVYANRNVVNAELQLVQSLTLSTSSEVTCTFYSDYIHSNSDIDVWTDVYGVNPCKVETYPGTCVVTFPKQSEAQYIHCKICVKNNIV